MEVALDPFAAKADVDVRREADEPGPRLTDRTDAHDETGRDDEVIDGEESRDPTRLEPTEFRPAPSPRLINPLACLQKNPGDEEPTQDEEEPDADVSAGENVSHGGKGVLDD